MNLDTERVRHLARLARLALPEDHIAPLQRELSRVIHLVDELQQANVEGVEPMAHPLDLGVALREDRVADSDHHAALAALAPAESGGFYLVPKVIE
jgi:aspartyl-tRNA(Asn)/glutamyl-tRNA(Gln) amidotransferase subunit C